MVSKVTRGWTRPFSGGYYIEAFTKEFSVMTLPWLDLFVVYCLASEELFPGLRQQRCVSGHAGDVAVLLHVSDLPMHIR